MFWTFFFSLKNIKNLLGNGNTCQVSATVSKKLTLELELEYII